MNDPKEQLTEELRKSKGKYIDDAMVFLDSLRDDDSVGPIIVIATKSTTSDAVASAQIKHPFGDDISEGGTRALFLFLGMLQNFLFGFMFERAVKVNFPNEDNTQWQKPN